MLQRRNLLTFAIVGALGAATLPAVAQPRGRDDDPRSDDRRGSSGPNRNPQPNRGNDRGDRNDRNDRDSRNDRNDDRGRGGPSSHARGVGPDQRWRRGDRLPTQYRHRQYVVNDWRSHRLSAPPRGYHWVQIGGDFALIAIATGLIAQLVLY